jgi:chemotaxis protein CheC
MEEKSAHDLVARLMGMPPANEHSFNEIEMSALKEIGNIITGAYLNSLSTLTNMKIIPSIPDLCVDMAASILSVPAIEFGEMGDKMLMIETTFTDFSTIDGYFILVPDLPSYDKMLSALGL